MGSGDLGSLAALIFASVFGVLPISVRFQATIVAFMAVVLGGIGSLWGAVLGGVLVGLAEAFMAWYSGSEFEQYVAYALECRRRVKSQMNTRQPDDELALIDLSYFTTDGREVVVYCPESKDAQATQQPSRRSLSIVPASKIETSTKPSQAERPATAETPIEGPGETTPAVPQGSVTPPKPVLKEQHYTVPS